MIKFPNMKKLIMVAILFALNILPVHAETVRTCSSVYGGGEVCGETTTHEVAATGASDDQMLTIMLGLLGSALVATGLYKLTYKSYILG